MSNPQRERWGYNFIVFKSEFTLITELFFISHTHMNHQVL